MTGLPVRGTCGSCGRVVDETAPAGRATWRGACPTTGCTGSILARRIKDTPAPAPAADAPPAPTATRKPRKVVKVSGYNQPRESDSPVREPDAGAARPQPSVATVEPEPGPGVVARPVERVADPDPAPAQPARKPRRSTRRRGHPYGADLFGW